MLALIEVLAILEARGANKVKDFGKVAIDPTHIIEIILENKIITLQQIVELDRSQLKRNMIYVIVLV